MQSDLELYNTIITTIITIVMFIITWSIPYSPIYGQEPVIDMISITTGYALVVIGSGLSLINWIDIISEWRKKQIAK